MPAEISDNSMPPEQNEIIEQSNTDDYPKIEILPSAGQARPRRGANNAEEGKDIEEVSTERDSRSKLALAPSPDRAAPQQISAEDLATLRAEQDADPDCNLFYGNRQLETVIVGDQLRVTRHLDPQNHTGWTRADHKPEVAPKSKKRRRDEDWDPFGEADEHTDSPFICLNFVHGLCPLGERCRQLHRLPHQIDLTRIPRDRDVFGRRLPAHSGSVQVTVSNMRGWAVPLVKELVSPCVPLRAVSFHGGKGKNNLLLTFETLNDALFVIELVSGQVFSAPGASVRQVAVTAQLTRHISAAQVGLGSLLSGTKELC